MTALSQPAFASKTLRHTGEAPKTIASLANVLALDDFEIRARRRLPRSVFGYVAGGSETESSIKANRRALDRWALVPRVLTDVSARSQAAVVLGHEFSSPFGIAPMGASGLAAPQADLILAKAATRANIPFILSGLSLTPLEEIARAAPQSWFQPYIPGETQAICSLLERAERAGYETIVITVDNPIPANRENNIRNGFTMPLRPGFKLFWDGLSHPRWLLETAAATMVRSGMPHFENSGAERGVALLSRSARRSLADRDKLSWDHFGLIRDRWRGKLVVKGVLSVPDALHAAQLGADSMIVSNHGGRQLDFSAAPLEVLPKIVAAVPGLPIMLDGGIRRGTDVVKAIALGASFVFLGRPMLYAAAIGGQQGVNHAVTLLKEEIDRDIGLLGVRRISEIARDHVIGPASAFTD